MTPLVLRVELKDEPGELGRITSRIGQLGGNIEQVCVHEVVEGRVVDELVVRLPPAVGAQQVSEALRRAGALDVVVSAPPGAGVDAVVRALALGDDIVEIADPLTATRLAEEALCHLTRSTCARIVGSDALCDQPAAARTADGSWAVLRRTRQAPVLGTLAAEVWLLVVQDPAAPDLAAVLTRRQNVRYTRTEVERTQAVLRLLQTCRDRRRPQPVGLALGEAVLGAPSSRTSVAVTVPPVTVPRTSTAWPTVGGG